MIVEDIEEEEEEEQQKEQTQPDELLGGEEENKGEDALPRNRKAVKTQVKPTGVIMDLVHGQPLAAKPNATSVLRCRWAEDQTFSSGYVLHMARQVAAALQHLHGKGIKHGDVYAHNIVADEQGNATLLDYGASFLYNRSSSSSSSSVDFERLEIRAYGLFLHDLHQRLRREEEQEEEEAARIRRLILKDVVAQCLSPEVHVRPTFTEVLHILKSA